MAFCLEVGIDSLVKYKLPLTFFFHYFYYCARCTDSISPFAGFLGFNRE